MADVPGTAANLVKALRSIDPELRKRFITRLKDIGKPVESAIKSALPTIAPLSHMNNSGRLGWNVGKQSNSTTLSFKSSASRMKEVTPLLSVRANSAATAMADIAGRKGSGSTNAGRAMIRNLNAMRAASRYVWPAGLSSSKDVESQIQITIDDASKVINERYK